ncbi:MAG: putative serine protease PepD [Frankiales bacterium]|nr:putative serine protease PepD [Frankiales bacterium]
MSDDVTPEASFGHPAGPESSPFGGPTLPPPAPPSWNPPSASDTISGPRRRSRGRAGMAAGVAALVVVSAGVGGAAGWGLSDNNNTTTPVAAAATTTLGASQRAVSSPSGTAPKSYADIAAAVLPVVVSIDVRSSSQGDTGSGVIIQSDGEILTNNHVVALAATGGGTITVHFNDGSSAPAKVRGTDLSSDLAVIKVEKTGLQVAHIGASAGVRVGDPVLAIGSPLGLSGTVTSGIVSALNRPVDTTSQQQQQPTNPLDPFGNNGGSGSTTTPTTATVFGAIQTDAAINPGNSGGALVDAAGNVIGINSAIASLGSSGTSQSGNIGVGFAIPIDLAKYVAQQLIATGKASHAQIGVGVQNNVNNATGVTTVSVHSVSPNTPGAKAGLVVGDVITKIDDTIVTDQDTLIATIRSHRPGDQVTLTIKRAGATKTVSLTLGASTS